MHRNLFKYNKSSAGRNLKVFIPLAKSYNDEIYVKACYKSSHKIQDESLIQHMQIWGKSFKQISDFRVV